MPDSYAPARPWSRLTEGLLSAGFWLVLGVLSVLREAVRPWREGPIAVGEAAETLAEYGLWALLTPAVFWMVRRFPAERGEWGRRLGTQVVVGVFVAFLVEAVSRGLLRPLLVGPLPAGREWTLTGSVGGLWFLDELVVYLAVLAAGYARAALFQVQERRVEADRLLADRARLEAQLADARLSALRMQLNPHFLFNTLNAVSALVERDPAGVRTMIARLSSLLRRVLEMGETQHVPLRDELAFLRDYLDVQRVRFQDRLAVEEDVDPDVLGALVPPLLLQPLVENAVGHGVSKLEEGVGRVRIAARREGDHLVLTVADNGPGLRGPAERPGGVGLPNTRARLDALYGDAGRLTLAEASGGGVVAEVALPYVPDARPPAPEAPPADVPVRAVAPAHA